MSSGNRVNLESLITIYELDQLKDIRVEQIPEKVEKIGEGSYGKVFLYKFPNGSAQAGKRPKINLFDKSAEEISKMRKVTSSLM